MINYSRLSYQLKREIKKFANKISKGLPRPKYKLVFQMLYGMLESQSTHLSNISRALKEDITLKKTIDRLSRNLNQFNENDILVENYMSIAKKHTNNLSVLIIDNSDISKPCSEMLDSLCKVRDGSTGEITKGYHLLEVTALTKEYKMPMPVYTRVYSSTENGFISEDEEVVNSLKYLTKHFGKMGIRTIFIYYALGDGIFNILKKTRKGIASFLASGNSPPSQQLDIFKAFGVNAGSYYAY